MKRLFAFAVVFALAATASAQLSKYKDWAKSPEAYFLTASERADWANVKTDADAEKFIDSYYARRGGDKFKAEIARRIAAADQTFKLRRQRGAESVRGHLLIVLGTPSRVSTTRPQQEGGGATGDSGLNVRPDGGNTGLGNSGSPSAAIQTWSYQKDKLDPSLGVPELTARINVDPARGVDELQNRAEVERVLALAAEKSVVNPSATASSAPAGAAPAPAGGAAAAPAGSGAPAPSSSASSPVLGAVAPPPPGAVTVTLPAATRSLLDSAAKADAPGFWGGTFHSVPGDSFYAVELSAPADKVAGGAKFAGLVQSEAGADVQVYYEDAVFIDAKGGGKPQKVYQRSIVLPPGSYRGSFGLVTPDGASSLVAGGASFQIPAKSSEFEVSPLILASTLTALTKRPGTTDPFVFGVEKPIRVDPQPGRVFAKDESLWYFYAVANPILAAGSASAPPAASAGATAPAPPPAEPKPRIMTRLTVLRDGQNAFQPSTIPAEMQILAPGYYATGTEIPLAGFEPGYYSFAINVRDLNAAKDSAAFKGIDRKQDFVVLKPDGTMPEKKAGAAAPAKPKPQPPKK